MGVQYPEAEVLDQQVRGKFLGVDNESVTLDLNQRVVDVASDDSAVTITLPNVNESAGKIFTIHAPDGATNSVTVTDGAGGSVDFDGDYTLNAADEGIVLYSDGRKWWALQLVDNSA